ncbi:PilZ domain-containing protein [Silvibacterium sp.]|uniref:PilZ domain-containing protein n=1 Tax=Silvibacterium sp. TaxID=1964179 RepID=UPI0039E53249
MGLLQPIAEVTKAGYPPLMGPKPRSAVRFPLSLPIQVLAGLTCYEGFTRDISASGILFEIDEMLSPGAEVEFLVEIPIGIIGNALSGAVHCAGRVVRSYREQSRAFAAAVIDHYSFQ